MTDEEKRALPTFDQRAGNIIAATYYGERDPIYWTDPGNGVMYRIGQYKTGEWYKDPIG